jgi:hypothetical protein
LKEGGHCLFQGNTPVLSRRNFVPGGIMVSVLAIGPKVRGFQPSWGREIFKGDKNQQHDYLQRASKAIGPMS